MQRSGSERMACKQIQKKYQALQLCRTDYDMNIECCKNTIPLSSKIIKLFGVTINNKLKFDKNIISLCRNVGRQVNALNRLKVAYHSFEE